MTKLRSCFLFQIVEKFCFHPCDGFVFEGEIMMHTGNHSVEIGEKLNEKEKRKYLFILESSTHNAQ